MTRYGLSDGEWRTLRALRTPAQVQNFLDTGMVYNKGADSDDCCYSPRTTMETGRGCCMEGALLAAAALRVQGHPPLIVDLSAEHDDDHVIALFRSYGCWGAVAKSNDSGLQFRDPVYRNLRELVMSYFNNYYNENGERCLRGYSRPVNLSRFDRRSWIATREHVWYIP